MCACVAFVLRHGEAPAVAPGGRLVLYVLSHFTCAYSYRELELPALYEKQEEDSYKRISTLVDGVKDKIPPAVFLTILDKIHKRQK